MADWPKITPRKRVFINSTFKESCIIVKHLVAIWGYPLLYSKVEFIDPISMPKN